MHGILCKNILHIDCDYIMDSDIKLDDEMIHDFFRHIDNDHPEIFKGLTPDKKKKKLAELHQQLSESRQT